MEERVNNLIASIAKIDNKENKILFYLPSMPQASGGIGVVYQHIKVLAELGYDAMVVYSGNEYKKPEWLGAEYTKLKHIRIDDKNKPLSVGMEDILVIPEGFPNIMEQTKNLPCKRVVLCQSYQYVLSSLMPGVSWDFFGIRDVIVVTPTLEDYLKRIFWDRFDIKICRPSVDDNLFKPSLKPKKPIIAISARDPQDVLNISKHFYLAHPQFKFISFKHMADMDRATFAETLSECCLGVWVDRIAGFGTFPLECAKSGVPFIGLIPNIIPEYAQDNHGIWTNNILDIPDLIQSYFKFWFEDSEPKEITEGLADMAKLYTVEEETKNIEIIYGDYISTRKEEMNHMLEKLKIGEQV